MMRCFRKLSNLFLEELGSVLLCCLSLPIQSMMSSYHRRRSGVLISFRYYKHDKQSQESSVSLTGVRYCLTEYLVICVLLFQFNIVISPDRQYRMNCISNVQLSRRTFSIQKNINVCLPAFS